MEFVTLIVATDIPAAQYLRMLLAFKGTRSRISRESLLSMPRKTGFRHSNLFGSGTLRGTLEVNRSLKVGTAVLFHPAER